MRPFALALLLLTLGATPALAQESATHEFAGFSSSTLNGGSGILVLNGACSEFGSDARMCNSLEIARTANPPAASGEAWVRPVWATNGSGGADDLITGDTSATCDGWSNTVGPNGMTVSGSGAFSQTGCLSTRAVACCTPIPEPAFASVPGLIPWAAAFLGLGMAISAMLLPRVQRRQLGHGGRYIGAGE
jgi:hypothetical protein